MQKNSAIIPTDRKKQHHYNSMGRAYNSTVLQASPLLQSIRDNVSGRYPVPGSRDGV